MDDAKVNNKYCHDCKYFFGTCEASVCCNYIFVEDKIRGCPPGPGCTKKVKRKRKRKMQGRNDNG